MSNTPFLKYILFLSIYITKTFYYIFPEQPLLYIISSFSFPNSLIIV